MPLSLPYTRLGITIKDSVGGVRSRRNDIEERVGSIKGYGESRMKGWEEGRMFVDASVARNLRIFVHFHIRQTGSREVSGTTAGWHMSGLESPHAAVDAESRQRVSGPRKRVSAARVHLAAGPPSLFHAIGFNFCLHEAVLLPFLSFLAYSTFMHGRRLESSQVTLLNPQWTRSDWGPQVPCAPPASLPRF
jgi:hypothetical protein